MATAKELYEELQASMGDLGWWPARSPDEVVIGTILTQNTSWTNVEKALEELRKNRMVSLERIAASGHAEIAELIRSSGFYNQKASRLIDLSRRILSEYGDLDRMSGDSVENLEKFLSPIKGIGKETMDSIILYALSKPAFVIDKYTERIFGRVGISSSRDETWEYRTSMPGVLENDVGALKNYHGMLVRLAKNHCRKKPVCQGCPVSQMCSYYRDEMLP